ncbi:hypothetical protein AB3538_00625 [Acinetobacter baumannii]
MDKPMTFNEWMGKQGNLALVHANCCRIAYEAGQQSQQAKVEELQTQLSLQRQRVKAFEEELTSSRNYGDELQKRVDAVKGLIEDLNKCYQQDHQNKFEYWRGFADSAGILGKD